MIFFFYLFFPVLVSIIMILLPLLWGKKMTINQIESGFETMSKISMKSFSINFFFLLILFIIFELEIIILAPIIFKNNFFFTSLILFFVITTLWIEWKMNKIKWMN